MWGFVTSHLTDLQHSGWFALAARDGTVLDRRKGHRWKACYHATRAVLNSAEALTRIERPGA